MRLNKYNFVEKARQVHGDKYDYSKSIYNGSQNKLTIICPIHGSFTQSPDVHINGGAGCPLCGRDKIAAKTRIGLERFIERARQVHGDKYDYSKVNYINSYTEVEIICSIHGSFWQKPDNHIRVKCGCPWCSGVKTDIDKFIERSKKIHGDKYDYSKTVYVNNKTKVCITCPIHGDFWVSIINHIYDKNGCPRCKESKGEKTIARYLEDHNIYFKTQYRFPDCKDKRSLPFDFYLPEYNMCIEYDGEQHFKPIGRWKGAKGFEDIKRRDNIKNSYCKDNGIGLTRIKYTETDISSILDSVLFG